MEEFRISSWGDFISLFDKFDPKTQRVKYLFRGVTDGGYDLVPGSGRPFVRDGENLKDKTQLILTTQQEINLFHEFRRTARPYISYRPENDSEWMAIGQHHGLKTRLLDWTDSLLYATYFAVENSGISGSSLVDVAVYAAPTPDEFVGADPFNSGGDVKLYRPPHISPRITAQRGVFTLHPYPREAWKPDGLIKYTIPAGQCLLFKRRLMFSGVSRASLYPDIDGLVQAINWRYKWSWD